MDIKFIKKEDVTPSVWCALKWQIFKEFKNGCSHDLIKDYYGIHPEAIEKLFLEYNRIQELDREWEEEQKKEEERIKNFDKLIK